MHNTLTKWPVSEYGENLIKHLKTRFMPGLPHIGVLGPSPNEEIETVPVSMDDSDLPQKEILSDIDDDEIDWNFVPNKMKYQITIKPTAENENHSKVEFYIRLSEGCDGDVGEELAKRGRNKKYILTVDELQKAFRHYRVFIFNKSDGSVETKLEIDGKEQTILPKNIIFAENVTQINLHDESEPFLIYEKGKPILLREEYKISIKKTIIEDETGLRIIRFEVINHSKKTRPSRLPSLDKAQTEDECIRALKTASKVGNDQENVLWSEWTPRLFMERGSGNNPSGNRYGYLMEFEISESLSSFQEPIGPKDMARITNAIFDDSCLSNDDGRWKGELIFRDHTTFKEQVPKMRFSDSPKNICQKLGLHDELGETLENDLKYEKLYKFQEDAIASIQKAKDSDDLTTVLISARTAGGKTESFAIPILNECMQNKQKGVKAIICYPTKALANDQASRFIDLIYHLNKRIDKKITLGILHGDIPKNTEQSAEKDNSGLPFECPKCKEGLLRPETPEKVICDNEKCKEELDFVWAHSQNQNYSNPPDILITNPDTLIWRIMMKPEQHSIFGKDVYSCRDCGLTYPTSSKKISCNAKGGCMGRNLEKITPSPPSFIVFDEVHLFKGSFGINTSYVLSRLESVIRDYAKKVHSIDDHKIIRIGSTATISNAIEFVKKFFNVNENQYLIVPENSRKIEEYYDFNENDDSFSRHHVYILPYAYSSDSTVGMTIQYLEALAKNGKPPLKIEEPLEGLGHYLQILTFVNSIKSSNSLIAQTRRTVSVELPDLQIDGHTTDFDKLQRSAVERKFNLQDLHAVFATSTLEVGVDFRNIHCVVINGFPYSFNDYLQRIGRGGRRGDALIVTVCQNWKPVDHYYYSHGRNALRDQHKNIEPVPITRDNSEAVKKHVRGALLDLITRNNETKYDLDDISSIASISEEDERNEINKIVLSACGIKKSLEKDALLHLDEFVPYLKHLADSANVSGKSKKIYSVFLDEINPRYNLTSLRSTDPDVDVEVFWNK